MTRDIGDWLDELGLDRYAKTFVDNEIDLHALPHITEEDLKEIGVALGARRKLLAAIAELGGSDEPAAAVEGSSKQPASAEAERRQLTVMFVDLVGSTALSERLDPEDLREVIRAYQETCSEAVGRFEGHIAKYIGDGLLVYFGYPRAHEDDARRAVSAGIGIVEGIASLNPSLSTSHGIELSVRVGVHTGLVVAGEMGGGGTREADAIVGATPNIAARLEGLAKPNTVAISAATQSLVEGLFESDDLGPQTLKGVSEPIRVFRPRGESTAHSPFEATVERGVTPLVGREEEIGLLLKRWEQAKDGEGQVVLLSGEAGVGKSRILRGFRERLADDPHSRVLYYCSAYHRNSALYPAVDQIQRGLRFLKSDSPAEKLDKLDSILAELDLPAAQHAAILAKLLSVPIDGRYPELKSDHEGLKPRTFNTMLAIIQAMAARKPVLLVAEDLHWIDPSTLEFMDLLIEELRPCPVLILATARPEFDNPWSGHVHVTTLMLNHLSRRESASLISKVTRGKSLPDVVLDEIIDKTDGVPLFIEELTKMVVESGLLEDAGDHFALAGPLPPLAIPASLQDSLMARLDRLSLVKEVAQLAAALGRSFRRDVLASVSGLDDAALDDALSKLLEAELIYRRGMPPDVTYEFKHALVQDTAYQSMLKSTRHQHHQRIAESLRQQFPEIAETEPEFLAHHFTEAGLAEVAIEYWHQAGRRANERSANVEAIAHLREGLRLIGTLPETPERDQQELDLRVLIGPALMAVKGFAAKDVAEVYSRSEELLRRIGESEHAFPVTWSLWYVKQHSGQIDAACELADKLLPLAEKQADRALLLQAHHAAWTSRFAREELHTVRGHAEQGIALYNMGEHRSHALLYGGHDPGMCCRIMGGLATLFLGFPDQALRMIEDGIELAEKLDHALSLALALSFSGTAYLYLRQPRLMSARMDALATICSDHGFGHFGPMERMLRGWAEVETARSSDGVAAMSEALAEFRNTGAKRLSFQLAILADAYRRLGRVEESLATLSEAISVVEETGERTWEPEIYRLKGETLKFGGKQDQTEAERCLTNAIELSRKQGAKWFELRASMSLSRYQFDLHSENEARENMTPIFEWFTEGFDTPDLVEAKALLDEMS